MTADISKKPQLACVCLSYHVRGCSLSDFQKSHRNSDNHKLVDEAALVLVLVLVLANPSYLLELKWLFRSNLNNQAGFKKKVSGGNVHRRLVTSSETADLEDSAVGTSLTHIDAF